MAQFTPARRASQWNIQNQTRPRWQSHRSLPPADYDTSCCSRACRRRFSAIAKPRVASTDQSTSATNWDSHQPGCEARASPQAEHAIGCAQGQRHEAREGLILLEKFWSAPLHSPKPGANSVACSPEAGTGLAPTPLHRPKPGANSVACSPRAGSRRGDPALTPSHRQEPGVNFIACLMLTLLLSAALAAPVRSQSPLSPDEEVAANRSFRPELARRTPRMQHRGAKAFPGFHVSLRGRLHRSLLLRRVWRRRQPGPDLRADNAGGWNAGVAGFVPHFPRLARQAIPHRP